MLILASKSPRREVLLRYLTPDFQVSPVDVVEVAPRALPVEDAIQVIARKKALAGSKKHPEAWVLAADTVVVHRGRLVGKARTEIELRANLADLAGEGHTVSTGVVLARHGRVIEDIAVSSRVTMQVLPPAVLGQYVASEAWVGKAGGYGVQDQLLAPYVTVEGSWSNVVGLPLQATYELLSPHVECQAPPSEDELRHHNPFLGTSRSKGVA